MVGCGGKGIWTVSKEMVGEPLGSHDCKILQSVLQARAVYTKDRMGSHVSTSRLDRLDFDPIAAEHYSLDDAGLTRSDTTSADLWSTLLRPTLIPVRQGLVWILRATYLDVSRVCRRVAARERQPGATRRTMKCAKNHVKADMGRVNEWTASFPGV